MRSGICETPEHVPVVDASVLVEFLAGERHARATTSRALTAAEPVWTPELADAEVGHVLRKAVHAGALRLSTARTALQDLADMPLHRARHVGLLDRAWALRANVTFYDGLYVALAERLDMKLLTLDARLTRVPTLGGRVQVIS